MTTCTPQLPVQHHYSSADIRSACNMHCKGVTIAIMDSSWQSCECCSLSLWSLVIYGMPCYAQQQVQSWHGGCSKLVRPVLYESTGGLTVNNLSYPKIHDSSYSGDGLVLSEVEGAHCKVSGAVVGSSEGHVQAGHLVDLTRIGQCQIVLQSTIPAAYIPSTLAMMSVACSDQRMCCMLVCVLQHATRS